MARRKKKNRSNDYTRLENRQLMAGDVTATLVSGDLIIEGDNQSNRVIVEEWNSTQIRVFGSDQTTVNGSNGGSVFTVSDDIRVNLNGGNDALFIRDLELDGSTHADLIINGDAGQDEITIENVDVRRDVSVRGGSLSDRITVDRVSARDIAVRGDSGNDNLFVADSTVRQDLLVRAGSGNDDMRVFDTSIRRTFRWFGDSGENATLFINVNTDNMYIYGGADRDRVNLAGGNRIRDGLFANMGAGDDDLWISDQDTMPAWHYLHGGDGSDRFKGNGLFGLGPWQNNYSFERWW